jgi:hypothetical protein
MSKLTKEQIAEFKETEKEAEDATEFTWLAEEVAEAGEKVWAKKLYNKAEELAEDLESYQSLADSVANDDYLGDKAWARAFYKKAEELAENSDEYKDLAESVSDEEYLGDKDYARVLYKKAYELVEDSDGLILLAESVEYDGWLGDKEWGEELRQKAIDNYKLIVAKSFDRGTSQCQGNEICIGSLSKKQSVEIVALLKNGTYLDSDYFNNFSQYNDLYHAHGILIGDTNDIYNLADDKDDLSKGSWEFLEGKEDISDVVVKDDLYLVTCRVEDVYFHACLPIESHDIPINETIELTAILDQINPMENIPSDMLSEDLDAPLLFLFKGVKCGYGEFERLPEEEEGAGFIYNTYQMIFHKSELLILISNRDHWESQFPFQDTEDYCPYLVSENELDQDKLNKSIQKLEEVTT